MMVDGRRSLLGPVSEQWEFRYGCDSNSNSYGACVGSRDTADPEVIIGGIGDRRI